MDEERPEETPPLPDSSRAKRPPPTIDLEPSEVSSEPEAASADAKPEQSSARPRAGSMLTSAVSGAIRPCW
jgi:hypothetical protein